MKIKRDNKQRSIVHYNNIPMLLYTILFILISNHSISQIHTYKDWQRESKDVKGLLPKYGDQEKSESAIKADEKFVTETMTEWRSKKSASNHYIKLGFQFLYKKENRRAMLRFNQAYLLDPDNNQIYRGYGAFFMALGNYEVAREYFQYGLDNDPENNEIRLDIGTSYLREYMDNIEDDKTELANNALELALVKIKEAYDTNPENSVASYNLFVCHTHKGNCHEAKKYLKIAQVLGYNYESSDHIWELEELCKDEILDCQSVLTGKFKVEDKTLGTTYIERNENFQIERNDKHKYHIKYKINWIDQCTYTLIAEEDLNNPSNRNLMAMILKFEIVQILEDGYVQISNSNTTSPNIESEVINIEEK